MIVEPGSRMRGAVLVVVAVGCAAEGSNENEGSGGAMSNAFGGAGLANEGGAAVGGGGVSVGKGGGDGFIAGGVAGVGGHAPTAGTAGAGTGGASGMAGSEAAGAAGQGGGEPTGSGGAETGGEGAGGGGGQIPDAMPSQGCGKGGRPATTNVPNTIVSFPESYDGSVPVPLVFGLHGANRTNEQFRTVDARTAGSDLEAKFVMAYVKSAGNGWVLATDRARIDAAYDAIATSYCIDTNRVFATGHSSGAQMIVQLLCAGEDRFRAVAPVASSMYCSSWAPVPALVIHGENDTQRPGDNAGLVDLGPYLASNECGASTRPHPTPACTSGGIQVDPGCITYSECVVPTIWCQHDDPHYDKTNHGWPCFANAAIDGFFSGS